MREEYGVEAEPSGDGVPGAPVRVLLADDERLVREGVAAILASAPGIEVVGQAGDGREALAEGARLRPDVALLDVRMPVLDGLGAAEEFARVLPGTAVGMLTTFSEGEYVERALAGGAAGFLLKSGDPYELIAGVRALAAGGAFLAPRVTRHVLDGLGGRRLERAAGARRAVARLTPREREVLVLLAGGLSNAGIAERLGLSEGTVKAYVSVVLDRLGVPNRVRAAVLAHEAGLPVGEEG
ncbi:MULTISPECIES: response regulator transcription factor [Streptomyces]|uniref:Response regulator transcription factor n=1 Tax=Streptomyces evansiae TaxID=3075535 RepID=A0ABU2R5J8_9ACTN|nr:MULTISPECIES: response regulator transcription factor [unclassified Streptomyces]MDT0411910.1 response regulator transcription factor [Streptomyces sp. DSM 41979]MDT0425639.1 response regulator transcription factor [Streptomyces sp. DSM 41859]WEH29016.1 response regulator transcription factor [Streptomyces sp. AM 3-1-1]SCE41695.1 two component transcriptional regulator, LuxR family [Streptomyces sp. DfronAA-171]